MGENRNRAGTGHGGETQMVGGAEIESQVCRAGFEGAQGKESAKIPAKAYDFEQHAPARGGHAPALEDSKIDIPPEKETSPNHFGDISRDSPQPVAPPPTYFGQIPRNMNHGPCGPTQWLVPNGMIGPIHGFAANLFQN